MGCGKRRREWIMEVYRFCLTLLHPIPYLGQGHTLIVVFCQFCIVFFRQNWAIHNALKIYCGVDLYLDCRMWLFSRMSRASSTSENSRTFGGKGGKRGRVSASAAPHPQYREQWVAKPGVMSYVLTSSRCATPPFFFIFFAITQTVHHSSYIPPFVAHIMVG